MLAGMVNIQRPLNIYLLELVSTLIHHLPLKHTR